MIISLIVPVYNGAKFLEKNFESVKNQIFRDFEVIYVNDGSTDNSLELLKKIKENCYDFSIKVIDKPNGGVSSARNAGIKQAEGKYLCFCDADDEILPEYMSYMYDLAIKNNVDMVFCSNSNEYDYIQKPEEIKETFYTKNQALALFLLRKIKTGIWTILCKTKIFSDNNFLFADGYKYSEDIHMLWRLFNANDKIIGTTKKLYIYNSVPGSAMAIFTKDRFHGAELMKQLEEYFKETNKEFAPIFCRFGVARIYWSILWQAAVKLSKEDYKKLITEMDYKNKIKTLLFFNDIKIKISTFIFLLSPSLFRLSIKKYATKFTHD